MAEKGSSDQPTPEKNTEEKLQRDLDKIMADLEEIQVFCIKSCTMHSASSSISLMYIYIYKLCTYIYIYKGCQS